MLRALYSLFMMLALPLIVARLWWRGRIQPGYRDHIGERFGRFDATPLDGAIWLHAVSVGEMRAAEPLVNALRERFPGRPVLLTCMTPTGRETARQLYGEFATIAYLPYDLMSLHARTIAHFAPCALLIMETEIWPNLVAACRRANISVALVNARLSHRSHARYARFAPVRALIGEALATLGAVGAQAESDARRLADLGAPPATVTGNTKFDVRQDPAKVAQGRAWHAQLLSGRRVLLAVSTRDGEERALLEAFAATFGAIERRGLLLVIVPRHPQRFDEVAAMIEASGLAWARRSVTPPADGGLEVWLGDSMGEVAAYVAMCDLAFVGGSLLPLGGQNLIEVCAQGKPALMGPSTFNFAEAARAARAAGALHAVQDASELMHTVRALLADPARLCAAEIAARDFAGAHRGATEATLRLVTSMIEPDSATEPASG